jgi:hypothetical protein
MNAENALTGTLRNLFAVAESYPDLKANANFISLQGELSRIEDEIAQSRKYYNAVVRQFNTKTEIFPSSIIAGLFHFEKKPMYVSSPRQNVLPRKFSFNDEIIIDIIESIFKETVDEAYGHCCHLRLCFIVYVQFCSFGSPCIFTG